MAKRFLVRGHDVEITGNDLKIFTDKKMSPHKAEEITIQLLMYLDSEGYIRVNSDPKPRVDWIHPEM